MQEIDIPADYNHELLSFNGYLLLIDKNKRKSRCGIYVGNEVKFQRRQDLEGEDAGLVVLDLELDQD